ncbi:hypothetical protein AAVH_27566 [Aphelenchoides avenae]|nr:hypothetical protein AAVH_27566 [Aphelenchus avenae]
MEAQLRQAEKAKGSFVEQEARLKERIKALEIELKDNLAAQSEATKASNTANKELTRLRKENEALENAKNQALTQCSKLEERIQIDETKLKHNAAATNEALTASEAAKEELARLKEENKTTSLRKAQLEDQMGRLEAQLKEAEKAKGNITEEVSRLSKHMEELQVELKASQAAESEAAAACDAAKKRLKRLKNENETLENTKNQASMENKKLAERILGLESQLMEAAKAKGSFESERKKAGEELSRLKEENSTLKKDVDRLTERIKRQESSSKKGTQEAARFKSRVESLEAELQQAAGAKKEALQAAEATTKELSSAKKDKEAAEKNSRQLEDKYRRFYISPFISESRLLQAELDVAESSKAARDCEKRVQELEVAVKKARSEKASTDEANAVTSTELYRLKKQCKELQDKRDELLERLNVHESSSQNFEESLGSLREQIQQLTLSLKQSVAEKRKLEAALFTMEVEKKELSGMKRENDVLRKTNEQLVSRIARLRNPYIAKL